MTKNKNKADCIDNRELSWLKFNERVLEEADCETTPLLERLKFISIFTTNLDEFFMVRVGTLNDYMKYIPNYVDDKTGMSAKEQLNEIYKSSETLYKLRDYIFKKVSNSLNEHNITFEKMNSLDENKIKKLEKYFKRNILPLLSPQIIDVWHPFPFIQNKKLNIVVHLENKKNKVIGIIPVPDNLNRIIVLDKEHGKYLLLEDVILYFAQNIFSMYKFLDSTIMCVTRNADIDTDLEIYDSSIDYRQHMKKLIKNRSKLAPVRIEMQKKMSREFNKYFMEKLNLKQDQFFISETPLDMTYCFGLENLISENLKAKLSYKPFAPVQTINSEHMIEEVFKEDRLLHFPFESMKPFLDLIKEASYHPKVRSIKMTLYRISKDSKLANYLINAAENGKEVTVLMELRARFDEENNIEWAQKLEEAGCKVIYGTDGFKVHSKICLITYQDDEEFKYITQVGTGNYNEKTAKIYTDLSFMTSNEEIGVDADKFFKNMSIGNLGGVYKKLWVAPVGFKQNIIANIEREIEKCKNGEEGVVTIKCNSFTDKDIIEKLLKASQAGVKVTLIIRGICCLIPEISGVSENIRVISIVGRFLEHSRIYAFGTKEDRRIYISSGDMMTRNTEHRVEISCPIQTPKIMEKIEHILDTIIHDNVKARILKSDKKYLKLAPTVEEAPINSQESFMKEALKLTRGTTTRRASVTRRKEKVSEKEKKQEKPNENIESKKEESKKQLVINDLKNNNDNNTLIS